MILHKRSKEVKVWILLGAIVIVPRSEAWDPIVNFLTSVLVVTYVCTTWPILDLHLRPVCTF